MLRLAQSAPVVESARWRCQPVQRRHTSCRAFQPTRPTLFDVPLSPYGARIRYYIYKYGLEDKVDVRSPADLGGLKSEEYLALHPAGKMPLLVLPSGQGIPESAVIQDYVLDAIVPGNPDLVPTTPEARAQAQFITQYLDLYFGRAMVAMYKPMDMDARADALAEINSILSSLEDLTVGPWLCGAAPTTADIAAMPHFVFITFMLPRFFGWDVFAGRPKLAAWWGAVRQDPYATRVIDEMVPALEAWEESGRWDTTGINEHVKTPGFKWAYP